MHKFVSLVQTQMANLFSVLRTDSYFVIDIYLEKKNNCFLQMSAWIMN